jgi:hypothetical protein
MLRKGKFGLEPQLLSKPKSHTINVRKAMEKEVVERTTPATTMPKTGGAAMETTAALTKSLTQREPILEEKGRARAKAKEATIAPRRKSLMKLD